MPATIAEVQAVRAELTAHYNRDLEWAAAVLAEEGPIESYVCVNGDYSMALFHDTDNACHRLTSDPAKALLMTGAGDAESLARLWNRFCHSQYCDDRARLPMVRTMTLRAYAAQIHHNSRTQLEFLSEPVLMQ